MDIAIIVDDFEVKYSIIEKRLENSFIFRGELGMDSLLIGNSSAVRHKCSAIVATGGYPMMFNDCSYWSLVDDVQHRKYWSLVDDVQHRKYWCYPAVMFSNSQTLVAFRQTSVIC